jgi:hypothetical protein
MMWGHNQPILMRLFILQKYGYGTYFPWFYYPRCTRSPSCWKKEEYLSWLYSNEAFNPVALINQIGTNMLVIILPLEECMQDLSIIELPHRMRLF